jgi:thiosulfate dehydrogenase
VKFSTRWFASIVALVLLPACDRDKDSSARTAREPQLPSGVVAFRVPQMTEITDSAMRKSVARGRAILEATRDSLPHNVGNSLRCSSCHLAAGTTHNGMPWVGVYSRYPQYRPRSGHVETIEDRINDCFMRSLNGRALGASTSGMRDIVAYMAFLSLGVPAGAKVDGQGLPKLAQLAGDTARGAVVFHTVCAACHAAAEMHTGDHSHTVQAPPLFGNDSYNDGAGMSRIGTLASFAHELMPFDKPRTLSVQQAYDVSAYINSRPRPTFAGRANDWRREPPPADLGYPVSRTSRQRAQ